MEKLWIIECGVRRRAEKHNCENCNKEFLRRTCKKAKKYCSVECKKLKILSKRIELICSYCKKIIYKSPSKLKNSKHGFYFCNRQCKEKAQSLKGNCSQIRPSHYGSSNRNIIKKTLKPHCVDCKEDRKFLLNIHHIDGDRQNNIKENLEIVCGNCHIKRHLYLKDGIWSYWGKMLTPREILVTL